MVSKYIKANFYLYLDLSIFSLQTQSFLSTLYKNQSAI